MARDLALLTAKGYRAEGFTPVDLFPQTAHCEVVGALVRGQTRVDSFQWQNQNISPDNISLCAIQYEHFWQTHTLSTSNIVSPQQGHIIVFYFSKSLKVLLFFWQRCKAPHWCIFSDSYFQLFHNYIRVACGFANDVSKDNIID